MAAMAADGGDPGPEALAHSQQRVEASLAALARSLEALTSCQDCMREMHGLLEGVARSLHGGLDGPAATAAPRTPSKLPSPPCPGAPPQPWAPQVTDEGLNVPVPPVDARCRRFSQGSMGSAGSVGLLPAVRKPSQGGHERAAKADGRPKAGLQELTPDSPSFARRGSASGARALFAKVVTSTLGNLRSEASGTSRHPAMKDWQDQEDDRIAPTLPQGWPAVLTVRGSLELWAAEKPERRQTMSLGTRFGLDSHPGGLQPSNSGILESVENSHKHAFSVCFRNLQEPDSMLHQFLDLVAFVLITYDLFVIPYTLAWGIEHSGFVTMMDWILVSFWSVDVALSFWTGFYDDGELVMSVAETARRYLRTWFLPDILMVLVDWVGVVLELFANELGESDVKMLKLAKMGKLLRLIDLIRFLRIVRTLESVVERHLSNSSRLALRMVSLSGSILWINHVLACVWYAVGRLAPSDTGHRWLDGVSERLSHDIDFTEASAVYQYATSFHWSISQCTMSSMEVSPTNSAERILICISMLFGLIFGSGLISLLSATLVEWRMMAKDRSEKVSVLRQYLVENQVEQKVALYVQRQVTERLRDKGRLTAKDVPALMILSSSARRELHANIVRPHMIRHPLFRLWNSTDRTWFVRLCTEAADITFLRPGDDLFNANVAATAAYFLISGKLNYVQEPESSPVLAETKRVVEQGSWLCEAVLWSEWIHVGKAEAATHCQVLVVQAQGMYKALQAHRVLRTIAATYGMAFHQRVIAARPPFSNWPDDIEVPFTDYGEMVASFTKEMQVAIGLVALDSWKPKGGHVLFIPGQAVRALEDMKKEVFDGKSLVVVNGSGEIERVVSVVVMSIMRSDGCVLVQVGKWEDYQVQPDCTLPAVKRERNELTDEAAQRLLATKLAPLEECTRVSHVEREITVGESKEYGLRTTYMRKVYYAELAGRFEAPLCLGSTPSFNRTDRTAAPSCDLVDALAGAPVYYFAFQAGRSSKQSSPSSASSFCVTNSVGKEKGMLCAWLTQEEFKSLKQNINEPSVQKWLRSLRPPSSMGTGETGTGEPNEESPSPSEPDFQSSEPHLHTTLTTSQTETEPDLDPNTCMMQVGV